MICDPSAVIREMIASIIKPFGLECLYSLDGKDALKKIERDKDSIELIFAETILPSLSGLELLAQVKKMERQIPLIFVTTESAKENVVRFLKAGASDFIVKPFSIQQIQQKIERFIHP